jgi:hypothetical protein
VHGEDVVVSGKRRKPDPQILALMGEEERDGLLRRKGKHAANADKEPKARSGSMAKNKSIHGASLGWRRLQSGATHQRRPLARKEEPT